MGTYNIFGEEFVVDEKLKIYANLKTGIQWADRKVKKIFTDIYYKIKTADELIEIIPREIARLPESISETAVETLVSYGIYTFDEDLFLEKYYDKYLDVTDVLSPFINKYYQILNMEDEFAACQKAIKASHRTWSGGGFGIKGAIKGAIQAEVLNQANYALHVIPDRILKSNMNYAIENAKKELLNNPEVLSSITDAIDQFYGGFFCALLDELEEAGVVEHYSFEKKKAEAIFYNLLEHENDLEMDQVHKLCVQMLRLDIFSWYAYFYIARSTGSLWSGEFQGDAAELAKEIGMYESVLEGLKCARADMIKNLEEEYKSDIAAIQRASEDITTNDDLMPVLNACVALYEESGLDVSGYAMNAITNRTFFTVTPDQSQFLKKEINKLESVLSEEQRTELCQLIEDTSVQEGVEPNFDKDFNQVLNDYYKRCSISPFYLYYVFEKATEGDAIAQDVFFYYMIGDLFAGKDDNRLKNPSKYLEKEQYVIYTCINEHISNSGEEEENNSHIKFWNGISSLLESLEKEGTAYIEKLKQGHIDKGYDLIVQSARNSCAIANYFLHYFQQTEAQSIAYLKKAVVLGSVKANYDIIEKSKNMNRTMYLNHIKMLGCESEYEYSLLALSGNFGDVLRYGKCGFGQNGRDAYFQQIIDMDDRRNLWNKDEVEEIINLDKILKIKYEFYYLMLKKGYIRYLMSDNEEDKKAWIMMSNLPRIVNSRGEYPLWCFTFKTARIILTNYGVRCQTSSGIDFVSYKNYSPGRFDFNPMIVDLISAYKIKEKDLVALIEECVAFFVYFSLQQQSGMINMFCPRLNLDMDGCTVNEEFSAEINQIISLLKNRKYKDAYDYAVDLEERELATEDKEDNIKAHIFAEAIAKVAQEQIGETEDSWMDVYLGEVNDGFLWNVEINRSDYWLEIGKVKILRNRFQADIEKPYFIYDAISKAAQLGNYEAIDIMANMCRQNIFWGTHKEWADEWLALKTKCDENKTNIFSLVEEIYLANGDEIKYDLNTMGLNLQKKESVKPYYDEDVNLDARIEIFDQLHRLVSNTLRKNDHLRSGRCLDMQSEKMIRTVYRIPQEETIYAFCDLGIPEKVKKGLVFTEEALYCLDKDKELLQLQWNDMSAVDKIYKEKAMSFEYNGKKLFGPMEMSTEEMRKIGRYIDYGVDPYRFAKLGLEIKL